MNPIHRKILGMLMTAPRLPVFVGGDGCCFISVCGQIWPSFLRGIVYNVCVLSVGVQVTLNRLTGMAFCRRVFVLSACNELVFKDSFCGSS